MTIDFKIGDTETLRIREHLRPALGDVSANAALAYGALLWTRAVAGPLGRAAFSISAAASAIEALTARAGRSSKEKLEPRLEKGVADLVRGGCLVEGDGSEAFRLSPAVDGKALAEELGWPWLAGAYGMVFGSPELRALVDNIQRIAAFPSLVDSVLVQGESGTGKELVARALHYASPVRRFFPFVAINCAGIPSSLFEAELFGIESRTATDVAARAGLFESAHRGTLFLDEVTETSTDLQPKLLRVLQERSVSRIGSRQANAVDVLVVAATNREPSAEMSSGRFRADLFHRLSTFELSVPPLRERREDIPRLIRHFLRDIENRAAIKVQLEEGALELLCGHSWIGNIRELQQVLRQAVIVTSGRITRTAVEGQLRSGQGLAAERDELADGMSVRVETDENQLRGVEIRYRSRRGEPVTLRSLVEEIERDVCASVMAQSTSSLQAARRLGLSPQGMLNKVKRYGLRRSGSEK